MKSLKIPQNPSLSFKIHLNHLEPHKISYIPLKSLKIPKNILKSLKISQSLKSLNGQNRLIKIGEKCEKICENKWKLVKICEIGENICKLVKIDKICKNW